MNLNHYPVIAGLVAADDTAKVLATTNEEGTPHLTFSEDIIVTEEGGLAYLEFEEYSQTNRNLTRSIWFNQPVAIHLKGRDGRAFEVQGRVHRALIGGPLYEHHYRRTLAEGRPSGLSTLWQIHPTAVSEETAEVRAARDGEGRIPLVHLDRLVR